jgi:hypothetical protein
MLVDVIWVDSKAGKFTIEGEITGTFTLDDADYGSNENGDSATTVQSRSKPKRKTAISGGQSAGLGLSSGAKYQTKPSLPGVEIPFKITSTLAIET